MNLPYSDPHGTLHDGFDPETDKRFVIVVLGHEPNEESGWRYKLQLTDRKYNDSDRFAVHAIAAGDSWQEAFNTAAEMVERALAADHCIF